MLITCSDPYRLYVDNVLWSPIAQEGQADVYLLASSGSVKIFALGQVAMSFTNNIEQDFNIEGQVSLTQRNASNQQIGEIFRANGTYVQARLDQETAKIQLVLAHQYSEEVRELSITSNQGTAVVNHYTTYSTIDVNEVSPSQYLQVMWGNVLVCFASPAVN